MNFPHAAFSRGGQIVTAPRATLLLVEGDQQIQRLLRTALEAHDYELLMAGTGAEGVRLAALRQPEIVIVDLDLPDISGLEVIRRLREWYQRPILVLSARQHESDKVAALDLGADDYLTKPFGIGELLARLRVAARHLLQAIDLRAQSQIEIGPLLVDLETRRVTRNGAHLHLTRIEYKLLATLARHRGKVLAHRQLLCEVWGPTHVESPQYLRTFMRTLRGKIEPDPTRPRFLLTDVGVGYRLVDISR
jgi:two-component system, OmpR family, KDP operon response regulator KdpE